MARYLIELPLIEQRMLKYCPSNLAASALFLSNRILDPKFEWTQDFSELTSYTELQLRPCVKDMMILMRGIETCTLKAVRKKFLLPKYDQVAAIRCIPHGDLPHK